MGESVVIKSLGSVFTGLIFLAGCIAGEKLGVGAAQLVHRIKKRGAEGEGKVYENGGA